MKPGRMKPPALSFSLLSALLALGCGSELHHSFAPNQPPEVRLDRPVVVSTDEQTLGYSMSWRADDSDGRVDQYVYALDPASPDKVDEGWTRGREPSTTVRFARRNLPGRVAAASTRSRDDFHVFAVRAVDDQGMQSATATLAVFEDNIAPTVQIVSPIPNAVFTQITSLDPTIVWQGSDLDGHIVRYKYRLFSATNPDFPQIPDFLDLIAQDPDTLRGLYGPTFATWDSVAAGKTSVHYSNLAPNQFYVFAIIAVDNRGAYTPVFSPYANLLKFSATNSLAVGPQICVSSALFNFCQNQANEDAPAIEIPGGTPIAVNWQGIPPVGAEIEAFRWALDPDEPLDGRSGWSVWSLSQVSTTLGPFAGGEQHTLVVQARDSNGLISTLRLPLAVVTALLDKDLLVVDDTRLFPDQRNPFTGGVDPPRGPWPTAAELDTFLYARGGVPWRDYPAGTLSPPGLLNGYAFDTVGTQGLVSGIVPLSVLSRYRHVIWMTDAVSATYTGPPGSALDPITSLRYTSSPGQSSTLAAYVAQGGKVWLNGGGAAYATLVAWNRRNTRADEFTSADGELVAGRFMYDFAYWRSGIKMGIASMALLNTPEVLNDPTAAPGRGWLGQPAYHKLTAGASILLGRSCETDPPSPLRACNSFYLISNYPAEFLFQPNAILEDVDPRPNRESLASALDTLYLTAGGTATPRMPLMTYYHGAQSAPLVFSGFPIWHFRRQQCLALTDFVLQDIWGLAKQTTASPVSARVMRRR